MPSRFEPATGNPRLNGVVVEADDKTGTRDARHAHQLFGTGAGRLAGALKVRLYERRCPTGRDVARTCTRLLPLDELAVRSAVRGARAGAGSRRARAAARARRRAASSPSRELTGTIRTLLEEQFFEIWVEGELSNCRVWNTGHMYFTLKDARRADQGRDVPLGAAAACASSRRTACASSRAAASASTTRRASIRSSASTSSPKGSARGSSPSSS